MMLGRIGLHQFLTHRLGSDEPPEWSLVDGDRHAADASGPEQTVRLRTDMALGIEGESVRARRKLNEGEQAYCALSWAKRLASPGNVDEANARLDATTSFWRSWLGGAMRPNHRFRAAVERSALTIKGLTCVPTGATVARRRVTGRLSARCVRVRAPS
jgi:GH15 family glucan-1,4-alpha-glucosidase